MAKSHSVSCKMVLVVAFAIFACLLCFSADAGRALVASDPPIVPNDECNSMAVPLSSPTLEECDACCRKAGHPGGYIKGDVCICNSG
ncbi:unnamed protein product [Urochloa decumbens]|uniref:Uncharacterized protein n=1 Tax=Urochloa decumbens TaxID=240449 RepID=A0ABC9AYT7_9POAL